MSELRTWQAYVLSIGFGLLRENHRFTFWRPNWLLNYNLAVCLLNQIWIQIYKNIHFSSKTSSMHSRESTSVPALHKIRSKNSTILKNARRVRINNSITIKKRFNSSRQIIENPQELKLEEKKTQDQSL